MTKEICMHAAEHSAAAEKAKQKMLDKESMEKVCNLFRVLSEPSRMRIVLTLLQGETCVYHIAESVGGTQSAVSHQLRVLKDNGVVVSRRDGQSHLYSLADEHIVRIIEMGAAHSACERGSV